MAAFLGQPRSDVRRCVHAARVRAPQKCRRAVVLDRLRFICLIGLLLFATVELRWRLHGHPVPPRSDFAAFPSHVADWSGRDLPDLSAGVKRTLGADNYLL